MFGKSNRKSLLGVGAWSKVGARTFLFAALVVAVVACLVPLSRASAEKPTAASVSKGGAGLPPLAGAILFAGPTPTVLHMHGNPTDDSGCTGTGSVDVASPLCNGPSLKTTATLGAGPAAHWDVANPAQEDGTTDRNPTDPDWVWNLSGPTRVGGYMPIQFWASCAGTFSAGVLPTFWL